MFTFAVKFENVVKKVDTVKTHFTIILQISFLLGVAATFVNNIRTLENWLSKRWHFARRRVV